MRGNVHKTKRVALSTFYNDEWFRCGVKEYRRGIKVSIERTMLGPRTFTCTRPGDTSLQNSPASAPRNMRGEATNYWNLRFARHLLPASQAYSNKKLRLRATKVGVQTIVPVHIDTYGRVQRSRSAWLCVVAPRTGPYCSRFFISLSLSLRKFRGSGVSR